MLRDAPAPKSDLGLDRWTLPPAESPRRLVKLAPSQALAIAGRLWRALGEYGWIAAVFAWAARRPTMPSAWGKHGWVRANRRWLTACIYGAYFTRNALSLMISAMGIQPDLLPLGVEKSE